MTTESTLTIALHEARARIEELETEVGFMDQPTTVKALEQREEMFQLVKEKEDRIAELEELAVLSGWQSLDGDLDGKYIITEAQLDAAWRYANASKNATAAFASELALKELGIERCEGCEHRPRDYRPQDCPDCDGHGWTIGGKG